MLENIVLSRCSILLWDKLRSRKLDETSDKAEVGKATNSFPDKSTDSTLDLEIFKKIPNSLNDKIGFVINITLLIEKHL